MDDAHDAPSTSTLTSIHHVDKDKAQYSSQSHNTTTILNGNGNDNGNDSGAVRSKIKGKGSSGESHGLMTADRGHSASASASLPSRPVLKKSHKKGVSKNEAGADAVNAVHFNGHGYTFVTKSLNLPGGGGGPGSREILHGVSKGSGAGDLGLGPDPGRGGPSFLPSSTLLHPQPSIASQRQRRTDGAAAGELPPFSLASHPTPDVLHRSITVSPHTLLSSSLSPGSAFYLSWCH